MFKKIVYFPKPETDSKRQEGRMDAFCTGTMCQKLEETKVQRLSKFLARSLRLHSKFPTVSTIRNTTKLIQIYENMCTCGLMKKKHQAVFAQIRCYVRWLYVYRQGRSSDGSSQS